MTRVSEIDEILEFVSSIDIQSLKWQIRKYRSIREWALQQLGIDYRVGDRVQIIKKLKTDNGWACYAEALAVGQTGRVVEVDFSEYAKKWFVTVALDKAWSVSHRSNGETIRYWRGKVSETPEGMVAPSQVEQEHYPDGKVKYFMLWTDEVRKHIPTITRRYGVPRKDGQL